MIAFINLQDVWFSAATPRRLSRREPQRHDAISRSRSRCVKKTAPYFLQGGSAVTAPGSCPGDTGSTPVPATSMREYLIRIWQSELVFDRFGCRLEIPNE
jgi:hypothetical protein